MDITEIMGNEIQKRAFGSVREAANHYIKLGFSVIPLETKGKKPIAPWAEYQNRIATPEEIHQWFFDTDYNLGIVTGRVSGLSVIDCDNESAVTLARAKGLPDCPTVKTGRGFHFYFKDQEGVGNFQKRDDLPGIDLRGQGGYVVAPPSVHANGTQYEWLRMANGSYLHLPEWAIEDKPKPPILSTTQALEGERNMALARLAGKWVKSLTIEDTLEQARRWNSNNTPPLPDSEVQRTVDSIWKAESMSRANQRLEIATPRDPADDVIVPADLDTQLDQLYESGLECGESPGWPTLAEHWTLRKGEWTLVTGIPAHGKSSFLDAVMVNLALYRDWKWAVFSAENLPHELHISNLAELYTGKPFSEGLRERISQVELDDALEFINDHFRFIAPPDDDETVSRIVEIASHLDDTWGIDGMVIDPWNELSHTQRDRVTETEHISQALKKIRRFASRHNVHAMVVAHPMKLQKTPEGRYPVPTPYDVSGSAHFRNKADAAICVWRDEDQPGETTIYVQKIRRRFVGKIGNVVLKYDVITGQFFEPSPEGRF